MKNKFFFYQQNEDICFEDGTKISPVYSTIDAEKLFEKVILNFKNSKYFHKLNKKNINVISIIYQDLFWHYCFNLIKYNKVAQDSKSILIEDQKIKYDNLTRGLERYSSFVNSASFSFSSFKLLLKNVIKNFISKFYILRFLLKNILKKNFHKVWVYPDLAHHNNFDFFKNLNSNNKDLIVIDPQCFLATKSIKFFIKNLDHSIFQECQQRLKNYFFWTSAISLLKPKKIILQDNLFNDFSILLAAKHKNIKTLGVIHGLMTRFHKGNIGSQTLKDTNILKYDKMYVWLDEFKALMIKNSYMYDCDDILVSGWLSNKQSYRRPIINTIQDDKKYILHAFEINSNFKEINVILNYFFKKGFKIILKKRYPYESYTQFDNIVSEVVGDFSNEHVESAYCAVCNASTFYYNYLNMCIPIVLPAASQDGYNFFRANNENVFEFSQDIEIKIKNSKAVKFDLPEPTNQFLREFQ
ncbi:hypothetical protein ABXT72_00670 [Candidatus Pelagibacter sp. Uisw_094]|uniref:hypothetical protein n=1 Tax=Candidatus Pelagibacter sp. Uisw_094 TaxID=3230980 RepID=UPI0039E8ED31|tara:strand:- start:1253 stop:2659 length:1407 start_codon:yes stop_codon:yes gene_type:complete